MNTRISLLRTLLLEKRIDAILISTPENIGYFSNIFIFSPLEREGLVLITKNNTYLFTDSRFTGMINVSPSIKYVESSARSGAYEEISKIVLNEKIKSIGFEELDLSVSEFKMLKRVSRKITSLKPADKILESLRLIKDQAEIKKISFACQLTDNAFRYIQPFINKGVTELELADRIDNFFRRNGASSAFPPIVAFGKHAAIPHHMPTTKKLSLNDRYILFDFGAKYNHYCADLSRTVFYGDISTTHTNQYNAVLKAQELSLRAIKKAVKSGKDIDAAARNYLKNNSFDIPHSVGHGIGLSVHERPSISPQSKQKIIPGMVITIEPGVYLPGEGGIRVEDTVLVTDDGYRLLTQSPKDLTTY